MGLCGKITFLLLTGAAVFIGIKLNALFEVPPLPKLENTWWGPGQQPSKIDTSIRPFKIAIPDKIIDDLKRRLDTARTFTPPLEDVQQQYGMNTNLLKEVVDYWRSKYNWRQREEFLNQFPQFKTNIQGLDIHFLHVKPKTTGNVKVFPMLLLHGWPGSVRELYEMIPMLTTPRKGQEFVFEVVVASLPGYGFSQATTKQGLGPLEMGVVFKNLMTRLGFEKFYLHGGDWGSVIVGSMATVFQEEVLGVHSNACFMDTPMSLAMTALGTVFPGLIVEKKYEDRMYPLSSHFEFTLTESGYLHLQATKPDTIGVGLNDSPVGLAAYILEKFTTWVNPEWKNRLDGGLTKKFTYDQLLDNVMIYWITNSATTSMRLYSECFNANYRKYNIFSIPTNVPAACAWFKHELFYTSESILKTKYKNLVQVTHYDDGGHFAAFEEPKILADDIWSAVKKMRTATNKN